MNSSVPLSKPKHDQLEKATGESNPASASGAGSPDRGLWQRSIVQRNHCRLHRWSVLQRRSLDAGTTRAINPSLDGRPDRLRTADVLTFGTRGQLGEQSLIHPDRDHLARPVACRAQAALAQLLNREALLCLIAPSLDLLFCHRLAANRLSGPHTKRKYEKRWHGTRRLGADSSEAEVAGARRGEFEQDQPIRPITPLARRAGYESGTWWAPSFLG